MKAAIPIGKVAGIPIRVHLTFLLAVAWIAWMGWEEGGWNASLWAAILILTLFVCVVLHEFGHSLVALAFGARVRSVTLYPIGGVASLENVPRQPGHELLMSLAGPAVNAVIAGSLTWWRGSFPGWETTQIFPASVSELRDALIRANIVLAVFNLLPAFPMDGGRVLRSLVALVIPYSRATSLAAAIGQALAVGMLILALAIGNPFLAVMGLFVFLGASSEERHVLIHSRLNKWRASDVMKTHFVCLKPDDPVVRCAEIAERHGQYHFPVVWEGRVMGLLSRKAWARALGKQGREVPVQVIMQKVFVSVDAAAPLDRLYHDLQRLEQGIVPVIQNGRMVGILTFEDITKVLTDSQFETAQWSEAAGVEVRKGSGRFTVDLG